MKNPILTLLAVASISIVQASLGVSLSDVTYGYDIFVKEDIVFTTQKVDAHGTTAAGRDVYSNNSNFNADNVNNSAYGLAVGGALELSGNQSQLRGVGGARIAQQGTLGVSGDGKRIGESNGSTTSHLALQDTTQTAAEVFGSTGIDFDAAFAALSSLSNGLRSMASTASTGLSGGMLTFGAAVNSLEIFNISGTDLDALTDINFDSFSSGLSKLVINVDLTGFAGSIVTKWAGNSYNGASNNVLWNFYGSNTLTLGQEDFAGSILAVGVDVTHEGGKNLGGSVFANSLTKEGGQIHIRRFEHEIPQVPDTGSTLLMILIGLPILAILRRQMLQGR